MAAQPALPQIADAATTRELVLEFIEAGVNHVVLPPVASGTDRPVR
jgi:hypothetical protein